MKKPGIEIPQSSDQLYQSLGQTIYTLRKITGVSQQELGKVLGLHQTAICRVENGTQSISPLQLQSLAQYFGISIDSLFSGQMNYDIVAEKFNIELTLPKHYSKHPHSKLRDSFPIFDFIRSSTETAQLQRMLSNLKIPEILFLLPDTAISPELQLDLLRTSLKTNLLNSKTFSKLIDQTRSENFHGVMHSIYGALLSPIPLLQSLIFNMHRYESNFQYKLEECHESRLVIAIKPESHMREISYKDEILGDTLCRYKKAYFSQFPRYIGAKPLVLQEKECHFHGSAKCIYTIKAA